MNVSKIQIPEAAAPVQSIDAKRVQLQAMLLKKSLESQQVQADEMTREADGKGRIVDLRV